MARTGASAGTYTRTDALLLQVRAVLDRTMDVSREKFEKTFAYGIRNGLIAHVTLYANDARGLCRASLSLTIDWERHRLLVAGGGEMVELGRRWKDGVSPDVLGFAEFFGEYAEEQELEVAYGFGLVSGIDKAAEMRNMGLVQGSPTKWADAGSREYISASVELQHLGEMTAGLRFLEVR